MAVKQLYQGLLALNLASVASATCPALCSATSNNVAWPCRYHANGCQVTVAANPARAGATDVNVAVINPYSGGLGELMTMVEPAIAMATQEVESSNFLPGFRMNVFLGDSKCTVPGATRATIETFVNGPSKHILLADSCSAACEAINDAAQFFNVLQVSPGCISQSLSDSTRYPYFTRMAPSYRFNVLTLYEFTKLMGFQRVGVVVGYRSINTLGADFLEELMQADVVAGRYNWTVLFKAQITSSGNIPDAQSAAQEIARKDSRINVLALYQTEGAMFLCQTYHKNMLSPDYNFMVASGWWNPSFILEQAGASDCPCTVTQLHRAAYGVLAANRGPMLNTEDTHGLSGRRFSDIYSSYTAECSSFGNGTGVCNHPWAGYFYDGIWMIASILHAYLVDGNRSVADLATEASRAALEALSLQVDFAGTTGRVRQFSTPDMEGDRDGVILLRQAGGPTESTFNNLAYRSDTGILFQTDVVWSPDPAHRINCSSGTCDLANGFRPPDRSSSCPNGKVWINELGCNDCQEGQFASGGAQCEPCGIGTFSASAGSATCQQCSPGKYSALLGARQCLDCAPGQFTASTGATVCTKCPLGTFAVERGRSSCTPCPQGLTTSFQGALEASMCSCDGFFYQQQQCIKCPVGTRFEEGLCVKCDRTVICESGVITGNSTSDAEWSATIDLAGQQNTLSQTVTAQFLLVSLGIDVEKHKARMQSAMEEYQGYLQDLLLGNSELQVIPAPNDDVREVIETRLTDLKRSLFSLLNDNVDLGVEVPESVLQALYAQNQGLFDVSNELVNLLVDAAQSAGARLNGLLANIAGRQRSLIQMMLKSVLFIAKEIYVGANVEALRNNLDIFEASHSAILRGAQWAGIPQLTSMCTIHQMKEVTFYFQRGRGLTRKIFNAQTQAESVLTAARVAKNMSDIVDPLAVAMSEAVKLYVNDPGDCDPLATITDREWSKLIDGLSDQRITSQKIARLYMQIANNVMVEQSKVDLAVEVASNTQSLTDLLEGSESTGMPAPPTQEMVDAFVAVAKEWSMMSAVFNEAIGLDEIPAVDVARIAILSETYQNQMYHLMDEVEKSALEAGSARPLLLLDATSKQLVRIQEIARDAALISYGYEVGATWERLNTTADEFHASHRELMLGRSPQNDTIPLQAVSLKRVSNVCLIRNMLRVEDEFQQLQNAAYQVAGGASSAFPGMDRLATSASAAMVTAAQDMERYYDGLNLSCQDETLPAQEWQKLMAEAYNLCSLAHRAVTDYVLQDQGEILPDALQATVSEIEDSLVSLMLGRAAPHLEAQPTQALFQDIRSLDGLVHAFLDAINAQSLSGVSSSAFSICRATDDLGNKYLAGGQAADSNWPGQRVRVLFQQMVRVNEVSSSLVQNEASAMWAAIEEFEAWHSKLHSGGEGLTEIRVERLDMVTQWEAINEAWPPYKEAVTTGRGTGQISMTRDTVETQIKAAVSIFGIPDGIVMESSPWFFVATYGTMALILFCCSALGCYMYRSANRGKGGKGGADAMTSQA